MASPSPVTAVLLSFFLLFSSSLRWRASETLHAIHASHNSLSRSRSLAGLLSFPRVAMGLGDIRDEQVIDFAELHGVGLEEDCEKVGEEGRNTRLAGKSVHEEAGRVVGEAAGGA